MIIISQSGLDIVFSGTVKRICSYKSNENFYIEADLTDDDCTTLGSYPSEERCKKVISEIAYHYASNGEHTSYRMPKE